MKREFYWSKSSISTIRACPKKFEHAYILHTEPHTYITWAFGNVIHYFLDRFYWLNYQTADSFAAQWKHEWFVRVKNGENALISNFYIPPTVEDPDRFFGSYGSIGANILKRFYNRHINNRRVLEEKRKEALKEKGLHKLTGEKRRKKLKEISIEAGLFPITEKRHKFEYEGHKLVAKIDRIDAVGDGYAFTDYKTGRPFDPKTSLYARMKPVPRDHQFEMYWLTMTEIFGKPPLAGYVHNLRQDTIFAVRISQSDISGLLESVGEAKSIKDFSLEHGFEKRITPLCDFCEFNYVCLEEEQQYPQELSELEAALEGAWGEPE